MSLAGTIARASPNCNQQHTYCNQQQQIKTEAAQSLNSDSIYRRCLVLTATTAKPKVYQGKQIKRFLATIFGSFTYFKWVKNSFALQKKK